MIVSFGASWPLNVIKSYKVRTTKGKSLAFLCLIFFGYIASLISKPKIKKQVRNIYDVEKELPVEKRTTGLWPDVKKIISKNAEQANLEANNAKYLQ